MKKNINSVNYWDFRFSSNDWEKNFGREQSRFFSRLALENFPDWLKTQIIINQLTVCDWGCATGDGTDVLASLFTGQQVYGVDFSAEAITKAKSNYPDLTFKTENWLTDEKFFKSVYDVVFSSNTLEHFSDIHAVLDKLFQHTRKVLIVLVPFQELERISEHSHTFLTENIFISPQPDFSLLFAKIINATEYEPSYWNGDQILLMYARTDWASKIKLNLDSVQTDIKLQQILAVKDNLNDTLATKLLEREQYANSLTNQILEYSDQLQTRTTQLFEKNEAIQSLESQLGEYKQKTQELLWKMGEQTQTIEALQEQAVEKEQTIEALQEQAIEKEKKAQVLGIQLSKHTRRMQKLNNQIITLEQDEQSLLKQLHESEETMQLHAKQIENSDNIISAQDHTIKAFSVQVSAITNSTGWQLLQTLWRIRLWLAPHNSFREKFFLSIKTIIAKGFYTVQRKSLSMGYILWKKTPFPIRSRFLKKKSLHSSKNKLPFLSASGSVIKKNEKVLIVAPTFFDFEGNNMYFGGAERYLIELSHLVGDMGYEVEIYQCATSNWVRYYKDIRVIGIDADADMEIFNQVFHEKIPEGILTIYFAFYLASPHSHLSQTIGISHGVYWDNAAFQLIRSVQDVKVNRILDAISNLSTIVSVDTNTINWMRATQANLAEKFKYIPNFVNLNQFSPLENKDKKKLTILYPRRLYGPRGFWLMKKLIPEFLEKYQHVSFLFVGKADLPEEKAVRNLIENYPNRVEWYFLSPENMHEAYQRADITVIPTIHSEGTSLSCLEALASGNAVIASDVGGLPNLIISGFNGLLIKPNENELRDALNTLIQNGDIRAKFSQNGRSVARSFSISHWRSQWKEVLSLYLSQRQRIISNTRCIVFPPTPGIAWEDPVKQRPHHLAIQMAKQGFDTYWQNSGARQDSDQNLLHIIGSEDELYLQAPILVIYYPYQYKDIKKYKSPFVIYDVLDDISIHEKSDRDINIPVGERAVDYHQYLLEQADVVTVSSSVLHKQIKAKRPDAILVPNGIDYKNFLSIDKEAVKYLDLLDGPIIGYHGAIADWLNFELLQRLIQTRRDCDFVFIGPISSNKFEQLRKEVNCHYIGIIAFEKLPSYISKFDVGIIPFLDNRITQAVRPLKGFEYLALNKPVVTSFLPEVLGWPNVFVASSEEEFSLMIDSALKLKLSKGDKASIRKFVQMADWEKVVQPLIKELKELR